MNIGDISETLVLGVVLAGGRSRRMAGQDKTLLRWGQQTLLERVVDRARRQTSSLLISTHQPTDAFDHLGLQCVHDEVPDNPGPLAGIISAMQWSVHTQSGHVWLASFAADTPFIPDDFVRHCLGVARAKAAPIVYARTEKSHYALALWQINLLPELQQRLAAGERALKNVMVEYEACPCDFNLPVAGPDPFFNINTPEEWSQAQEYFNNAEE